jgi:hypothetical protein
MYPRLFMNGQRLFGAAGDLQSTAGASGLVFFFLWHIFYLFQKRDSNQQSQYLHYAQSIQFAQFSQP